MSHSRHPTVVDPLDDLGIADNTIVVFTTDNGAEVFTWPDGVFTFLAEKYKAMTNPETNYGLEEAGMAQLDKNVGELMKAADSGKHQAESIRAATSLEFA
jgi:hypothetical protein